MKPSLSGSTKMTRSSSADWHRKWASWLKMSPLYRIPAMPSSEPGLRRIRIALRFHRARAFGTCTSPSIGLALTTGLWRYSTNRRKANRCT